MPKTNKKFWNMSVNAATKEGELYLYGPIASSSWWDDVVTPKQFKKDLDALGNVGIINVYINSGGGDVFAGQAIHSMLKRHKAHVNVHVDGLAASIASVIAMAGDTIYMPRNAMMMVHHPWSWGSGNASDFRKMAEDLDKIGESIIAAYEENSSLTRDEIVALMDAETWMTADDALSMGFCHQITEEKQMAASIQDGNFVFNGQQIAIEKMKNSSQLFSKLPSAAFAASGIDNQAKKEESIIMDFTALVASLPAEHQAIVNARLTEEATKQANLQTQLAQAQTDLQTAQNTITELQAAAKPPVAEDDDSYLDSLPEKVKANILKDRQEAAQARESAQRLQDEAETRKYVDVAKTLDKIPVKAEEFGATLKTLAAAAPEAYAQVASVLGAVNAALDQSLLFESMGSANSTPTGTALDQLNAKAAEIAKRDSITKEQGFAKACRENKELYAAYQKELRGEE